MASTEEVNSDECEFHPLADLFPMMARKFPVTKEACKQMERQLKEIYKDEVNNND
ncbi:hypothetical protein [Pseudomonas sp. Irchel 3A7]|uniref:hypothetical protein n=1 Tax=Pseudomonas sp. Irchel 3A7 TaxID=2008913 RepID=UPI001482625F|nr:hypothetical protein [Pseudomonas sp. Irchel 3A7]